MYCFRGKERGNRIKENQGSGARVRESEEKVKALPAAVRG